MLTSVALLVSHDRVVDWPFSTVFGFADNEAVGAGGGGGGGGGGGATFFLHAPRLITSARTRIRVVHFTLVCFISPPQDDTPWLIARSSNMPGRAIFSVMRWTA